MARIGLSLIETSTDYVWSTDTGTTTPIALSSIRKEGLQVGQSEEFTSETADMFFLQDGIRWSGSIFVEEGTTVPANGTQFWLVVTPLTGTARAYGGELGCKGRLIEDGMQTLDGGRLYQQFAFTFSADSVTNGIHDYTAP